MSWEHISEQDRDRLYDLRRSYLRTQDNTIEQSLMWEATRFNIKYVTLLRRLIDHGKGKRALITPVDEDQRPSWQGYLRTNMDDCLFISDLEVPDHNEELLSYAQQVAKIYELNNVIWAGDINAQDEPGLSTHGSIWEYKRPSFHDSIGITKQIFNEFDFIPNQYFISGNHDDRMARATSGAAWFGMFFPEYKERITFSRYPFMYINTSRGLVKVTHPKQFSENAINLGRNLINKNKIKSHIIMAHTHQGQRGHSKDGQHEIIALGCMRCPTKTQYKSIVDNTFGEWQPGFAFMKEGYFYMLNQYTTNWKAVLRGDAIA